MTIREWLSLNAKKFGSDRGAMYDAAVKELSISRKAIINHVGEFGIPTPVKGGAAPVLPAAKPKGIRVNDLLRRLNYPERIVDAINKNCKDQFVPEFEFRVLTGLTGNQFRSGVNAGDFGAYTTRIEGVTYWSTQENIAKAESMRSKV